MEIKKIFYSIVILALIVFGSQNDMIGAGTVLFMYAGIILFAKKSEFKFNLPCICILVVILLTLFAGVINNSSMHDTCVTCVKLSALGIPFLLKRDFCKEWILPNVYISITVAAAVSLVLYAMRLIAYHGFGDLRMQSVIEYANSSCILFLVGVYISVYYMKCGYIKRCIPLLLLCAVAAVLTFSRLGFACFAFSIIMYIFFRYPKSRHYILTVLISVAIVGIFFVLSGYYKVRLGSTMVSRIECWTDALGVIFRKPLGIGAGSWKELQYSVQSADYSVFQIHNSFLQIMLDGGIPAFLAFIIFIVYVIRWSEKNALFLSVIVLMLSHAFVDMDFYFICITFTLGTIMRLNYGGDISSGRIYISVYAIVGVILCSGVYLFDSTDNNYVKKLSNDYEIAYSNVNVEDMYRISSELVSIAPKQKRFYGLYRKTYIIDSQRNGKISDAMWKVYADEKNITMECPPAMVDDKLLIPIRVLAEIYGYNVKWDNVSQIMSVFKDDKLISNTKVENRIYYNENGQLKHYIGEIFIVGNRLMVRVDKVGNYLPVSVQIDDMKTVYFNKT